MKLMLTSDGLSSPKLRRALKRTLRKEIGESKVVVLYTRQRPEFISYTQAVGRELGRAGILMPHVRYVNISQESAFSLDTFDVAYVCGGNTFYILDQLRRNGFDYELTRFVRRGGVYVGVSAGSIIAGKDISLAGFGSEGDPNEIGLKDLSGLSLTDVSVFPHYKVRLEKEVKEFQKRSNYPVFNLRDREAILIEGKRIRKVK